jgi:hypothetical protein
MMNIFELSCRGTDVFDQRFLRSLLKQWRQKMATPRKNEQGEALATFAESSRSKRKVPKQPSLQADEHTAPVPTESKKKDKAATKVLAEGATGTDQGSEEAVRELPDRIIDSRD